MSNEKLREKLYKFCEETNTNKKGIENLLNFYTNSLGWSEEKAIEYTINLFLDGTIAKIKILGKGGN